MIFVPLTKGRWHDDVIKWKHVPLYRPFVRGIHRLPVNSPYKGQRRGALMFTLICAWINGWVNNREAGDLRRHRAHYDVTVMAREAFPCEDVIVGAVCLIYEIIPRVWLVLLLQQLFWLWFTVHMYMYFHTIRLYVVYIHLDIISISYLWLSCTTTIYAVNIGIRAWIGNYICVKQWDWMTHLCPNFNSGLVNTLRPRRNRRHFTYDIFKCIFLNENVWISVKISLKFVPNGPIDNIPALVQIMAWRRWGDKPLFEQMMVSLPTHICVTRPQWVTQNSG